MDQLAICHDNVYGFWPDLENVISLINYLCSRSHRTDIQTESSVRPDNLDFPRTQLTNRLKASASVAIRKT